jgi:creatinine amidohydrolase
LIKSSLSCELTGQITKRIISTMKIKTLNSFGDRVKAIVCIALTTCSPAIWAGVQTNKVFIEELTSFELREKVMNGTTTVLIPIGGTEQNGPHMALGKHNVRVKFLAGQIAQRLGNAVVAPVLAYVPEGAIFPPVAHMRFTGTISIPEATFESILEATARSFKQHGFHNVVFLGDHGGYQKGETHAAEKINKEWSIDTQYRAFGLTAYYEASLAPFIKVLKSKGFSDAEIGLHAGLSDTSLTLAVDPSLVRMNLLAEGAKTGPADGVYGDPRRSSAELGQIGVQIIVDKSVQAIQDAIRQRAIR